MKKTLITVLILAVMTTVLTACGGGGGAASGSAPGSGSSGAASGQQAKNWAISADDLQAKVEKDFGYVNEREMTDSNDKNKKTHREEFLGADGTSLHFVDIGYSAADNRITQFGWYYDADNSDLDYWMETVGLVITDPDDQKIIRDILSQEEIPAYQEIEISDATGLVQNSKSEDRSMVHIFLSRA